MTPEPEDHGKWKYEDSLDGYGPATRHVWVHEEIDGVVKIALSEGGHIMKCDRGDWLVTVNIDGGPEDKHYCFETETQAINKTKQLLH